MHTLNTPPRIVARSGLLHRWLTGGPMSLTLDGEILRVEEEAAEIREIPVDSVDEITVHHGLFRSRLTIHTEDEPEYPIGGLNKRKAELIYRAVLSRAARRAEQLGPDLLRLDERRQVLFNSDNYVRYSSGTKFHEEIASVVGLSRRIVRDRLDSEARAALGRLEKIKAADRFEKTRSEANEQFVSNCISAVHDATREVLQHPLTEEQAKAIATDEDATLVLAGAGTGKTSVIVGKVAHLVYNLGVPPDEILVLAYNNKAAGEIRERLTGSLSRAHVRTFHAFGKHVITDITRTKPDVSPLAEDYYKLKVAIQEVLDDIIGDSQLPEDMAEFIVRHHAPYRSAFDFDMPWEYNDYIRHIELRTLSGDKVKSFEELVIANYLTEHGIRFEYEKRYEVQTATFRHRQYQPDFFLPDYGIYIEHFALDKRGRPPPHWTTYEKSVQWKREIHRQYGTKLIETYSWQYRDDSLLSSLHTRLERYGVTVRRESHQTIMELVRELAKN